MSFEVLETDLLGRIGKIKTKSGYLETPALLPVIHPVKQEVSLDEIKKVGFKGIITNAYITMKYYSDLAKEKGIHALLNFEGVIMTDSGGYQILNYGDIDVEPEKIAEYEKALKTDIAVILDTPTGFTKDKVKAKDTVMKTLEAARRTIKILGDKEGILWCGTIQGGRFLDLLEYSTKELVSMNFDLLALGSPTEFMESYNFEILAKMILKAKMNMPLDKPLHLFGAGHPLTIPLGVALGCDLFDSASYILYAKSLRYLSEYGTYELKSLNYFPCSCPICSNFTPKELLEDKDRVKKLALHNLYNLMEEIRRVKQAIKDGRLWDYLSVKAHFHPNLKKAFNLIADNSPLLEDGTPLFKPKAIFFKEDEDLKRPEFLRFKDRIKDINLPSKDIAVIIQSPKDSPLILSNLFKKLKKELKDAQFFALLNPWGILPVEITDLYPFSQYLCSLNPKDLIIEEVKELILSKDYKKIYVFYWDDEWMEIVKKIESLRENVKAIKSKNYKDLLKEV